MTLFYLYHPSNVQWLPAGLDGDSGGMRKKKKKTKKQLELERQRAKRKAEEEILIMYVAGDYD